MPFRVIETSREIRNADKVPVRAVQQGSSLETNSCLCNWCICHSGNTRPACGHFNNTASCNFLIALRGTKSTQMIRAARQMRLVIAGGVNVH